MKNNLFIIIITGLFLTSCEKYLDKAPNVGLDETAVFNSFSTVSGYLDKCYPCVNDFSFWNSQELQRAHVSQMSDEGANSYVSTTMANIINKGAWLNAKGAEVGWSTKSDDGKTTTAGTNTGKVIPNAFLAIRIANKVIEKIPSVSSITDDQKNGLLGQAYFFRAWFYFEIIRRVGGMPILDKAYAPDDNMDLARLNYGESTDWLIKQLDEAIKYLPDEWPSSEKGRPIKAAAYALKSMAELYAASPLMNNPIDQIVDNGYNTDRCVLAAQYAKEALDYINTTVPVHNMMSDYKHIFYHSPNFVSNESLWYLNSTGTNRNNSADLPIFWQNCHFSNRPGNYGQANVSASQNMVDLYETSNGYPVKLQGSQWVTDDPAFDQANPYNNRDPRLGMTILVPGEQFGTINNLPNYVATWENGKEVFVNSVSMVRTHYMIKKWQWPETVVTRLTGGTAGYGLYFYNCIHIRTTQVWLDYAEAMNEAYGPQVKPAGYTYSAVDAINMVRQRVGMAPVRSEYTTDKVTFRSRIRNERGVELMFENHRWFDIRRWLIAVDIFNRPGDPYPIKGVKVTASAVTKKLTGLSNLLTITPTNDYTDTPLPGNTFTYQLMDVKEEVRVFSKKNYWYPVGYDEANRLYNFKQNPGW